MNHFKQKKRIAEIGLIMIALVMLWLPVHSQTVKTMTFEVNSGEMFMLPEVGGIIVESDKGPKLEIVLPEKQRPEEYKTVDIQTGDIIKMFNGKSMKTVSSVEETYNSVKIGDELKFGIKRGKDMLISRLIKMDPKDASAEVMVKRCPASGGGDIGSIITDLIDLGLVLTEKDGEITIADVITEMASAFIDKQPENGDRLVKIQSNKIGTSKDMIEAFKNIKSGEKADLTVLRGNEKVVLQFVKPESGSGGQAIKVIQKQGQ